MLHQVILVSCLDQMIWVRISVRCASGLALASYLSIRRVGGLGGAKVVTSYAGMVPGYAGSLGYYGAPRFDWGRPQVVTALSARREAASRLAYSPTFEYHVGVHAKMKRDWMFSSAGHSPRCP